MRNSINCTLSTRLDRHKIKQFYSYIINGLLLYLMPFAGISQTDQLIDSLKNQLTESEREEQKAKIYLSLADHTLYNIPDESLDYARKALELSKRINDGLLISKSYYRIGSAYWSLGNLPKALDELQQSMPYLDLVDDYNLISQIYMRVGSIYAASDDYTMAMVYYSRAIRNFDLVEDDFIKFAIYNNMGKSLLDINYLDSAEHYFNQAIAIKDQFDERFLPILLFNIAELQFKQGRIEASSATMKTCDSLAIIYNDIRARVRVAQLTSEIQLLNNQIDQSLRSIMFAKDLAMQTKVKELIAITNETCSKVLEASGRTKEALDALRLSKIYFDSIQSTQVRNKLELYKFDESEKEKDELRKQQEIIELKAKNQQTMVIATQVVSVLMIILAIAIIRRQLIIQKQNKKLHEKNELIEEQKEQLDYLNNFKTKMMAIMAHDVKGPIQSVYGIMELLKDRLVSAQDVTQILPHMHNQLTQVNLLLNNIFEWSRAELNEQIYRPEVIQIDQLIGESIEENSAAEEAKKIRMINDVPKTLTAFADPNLLRVVLRNLIFNAIKYSHEGGNVTFKAWSDSTKCMISIADEGVGMNEQTMNRLFSHDTKSMLGTANEVGTGFGLIMCKDFMTMNQGSIEVSSEPDKGTTFTISLPISA